MNFRGRRPLYAILWIIACDVVGGGYAFSSRNPESSFRRTQSLVTPTTYVNTIKDDPYQVATLLLGTLLDRPGGETTKEQTRTLQDCIAILSNRPNNSYDPSTSLLGPLYCTLYAFNPSQRDQEPPLWERISALQQATNRKGQQYFLDGNFQLSVINYAEIWGPTFSIRAEATFEPSSSSSSSSSNAVPRLTSSSNLRSCPDVFDVQLTKAELSLSYGARIRVPIPIRGGATFAILYADPRLRILQSGTDSESIVGRWERSGLIAVQVRSDFVTDDSTPIDVR